MRKFDDMVTRVNSMHKPLQWRAAEFRSKSGSEIDQSSLVRIARRLEVHCWRHPVNH